MTNPFSGPEDHQPLLGDSRQPAAQQPGAPFDQQGPAQPPPPNTNPVNVPNALTVLRLLMVPLFAWMVLSHPYDFWWRIATTGVFTLAIITDAVDGHLARKYNIVTSFGKIADPIADKALTGMAFIGLSIIGELLGTQPDSGAAGAAWWITITILVREWGITLMRFLFLRRGVVLAANRGGKLKTVVQSVALIASLLPLMIPFKWGAWILVLLALVITVVTGIDYLISMIKSLRQQQGASAQQQPPPATPGF
ncbi:CDP-diacylglycerol--glycerol-3-phosphate 3-phosphatidyltransferase [Propionibacteriaceae bacterium Y2011]